MGIPATGTIVTINFPFSDLSPTKRRPAMVLASVSRGDVILCQIISKPYSDPAANTALSDFSKGSLNRESFVRPGKLFTTHQSLICQEVATIKEKKFDDVIHRLLQLFLKDNQLA